VPLEEIERFDGFVARRITFVIEMYGLVESDAADIVDINQADSAGSGQQDVPDTG